MLAGVPTTSLATLRPAFADAGRLRRLAAAPSLRERSRALAGEAAYGWGSAPAARSVQPEKGGLMGFLRRVFLPQGYPRSVHPDYAPSRRWAFVRNLASGAASYFGTAAVVGAMGFGAIGPLTAGMAWMIRDSVDGLGRFAGSFYAHKADQDPRGWSVRGEIADTLGVVTESALAVAPQLFLVLAPVGNLLKAGGSAVKNAAQASIEKHQAVGDNVGEVRAKNNNQEMLASGLGVALGYGLDLVTRATVGPVAGPVVAAALGAVSLYAQIQYSRALQMHDLNPRSVRHIVESLLSEGRLPPPSRRRLLSDVVEEVKTAITGRKWIVGSPVEPLTRHPARFERLRELFSGRRYLVDFDGDALRLVLHRQADRRDTLAALVHATLLEVLRESPRYRQKLEQEGEEAARWWALEISVRAAPPTQQGLLEKLAALGWNTERIVRGSSELRAEWQVANAPEPPPLTLEQLRKRIYPPCQGGPAATCSASSKPARRSSS